MINGVKQLNFPVHEDNRGTMVVLEGLKDIPFEVKRLFYIYGTDKSSIRGQHANRNSEFVLINVAGHSKVRIKDGKGNEMVFLLDGSHKGVYLPAMLWKEMYDFSNDSILLVLASTVYDAEEYIRDYHEFEEVQNS